MQLLFFIYLLSTEIFTTKPSRSGVFLLQALAMQRRNICNTRTFLVQIIIFMCIIYTACKQFLRRIVRV